MKKTFFVILLLCSLVLPGCGDYEDEQPSVKATTPGNGAAGVLNGASLMVIFNMQMDPVFLSGLSNYSVEGISGDAAGIAWPYFSAEPPDPDTGLSPPVTFTATPSSDGTYVTITSDGFLLNDSCFLLKVSSNIRSISNISLEAPYQSCFCTAVDASPCAGY